MTYRIAALSLIVLATSTACSSLHSWRESLRTPDSASAGATAPRRTETEAVSPAGLTRTPGMDPKRTVAAQDCSKPVELFQGNLRCK